MNRISEDKLFEFLKTELTQRFLETNSAGSHDISEWKGQDIVNFQEDVFDKTKSTVSEKWFYTYFKSDFEKLPRIDMLNILSEYLGYSGWAEFVSQKNEEYAKPEIQENIDIQEEKEKAITEEVKEVSNPKAVKKKKLNIWLMSLGAFFLAGIAATLVYFGFFYKKTYEFCFIDADRNSLITEPVEITIDRKGFKPLELFTEDGCVEFSSLEDTLLMSIKSTYYKQDTFKINLHLYQGKESIRLEPDDYKVMLRHYSKSSKSVKERIKMLDHMIADDALIYQVYDNEFFGVEVLNKQQYINLVSLPTTSLRNFTLIEAERVKGKIVKIKFKIHSDEES